MDALTIYLKEIEQYPVLNRDQEYGLAVSYKERNNLQAAKQLVQHNLRFVVKIAKEYCVYCDKLQDLVQEGTIGLMMAVKKFDPYRGIRLLSYAIHWIRAYIQNYILKTWSLVKLGTTELQRKMFPKLKKFTTMEIAESLNTEEDVVLDFQNRVDNPEFSLNVPMSGTQINPQDKIAFVIDESPNPEELFTQLSETEIVKFKVKPLLNELNEKELYVIEHRLTSDEPVSLQEIGDKFGISRERVRQIENNLLRKLKEKLK